MDMHMSMGVSGNTHTNAAVAVLLFVSASFYFIRVVRIGAVRSADRGGDSCHLCMNLFMGLPMIVTNMSSLYDGVALLFIGFSVLFVARLVTRRYLSWWQDVLHLGMSLGMAYQMYDHEYLGATIIAIVFFAVFALIHLGEIRMDWPKGGFSAKATQVLVGHGFSVFMGIVMIFILMRMTEMSHSVNMPSNMHM